jgi:flagellar motor switch protein FliM
MEPVLSKKEIADLLAALRSGKVSLDLDQDPDSFLPCSPVNLFQMARPEGEEFRIPNLDIIVDIFCRLYATSLTNQLQRTFSITRTSLQSFEFQEVMADRNVPGAIGILDMAPLKHGALVIFDPKLSFSMIEIMLGAASDIESLELSRRLTTIELNILKTLFVDACTDINKSFAQLGELKTNLIKLENNARLVSIVEPEAEVIVATLVAKAGEHTGEIQLVFPFATLEPLRDLLKELLTFSTTTRSSWQTVLEDEVESVPVSLIAQSGTITLSVERILNLEVDDILEIDYNPNNPLTVMIEDIPKFSAIPGTLNGKKAISITEIMT